MTTDRAKRATDEYNALPFEVRRIFSRVSMDNQLRDLRIEKARAIAAHRRHLQEINAHMRNVEKAIREHDAEKTRDDS